MNTLFSSVAVLFWNKALWLAPPSHVTRLNQLKWAKHSYATLKFVYDINSRAWDGEMADVISIELYRQRLCTNGDKKCKTILSDEAIHCLFCEVRWSFKLVNRDSELKLNLNESSDESVAFPDLKIGLLRSSWIRSVMH